MTKKLDQIADKAAGQIISAYWAACDNAQRAISPETLTAKRWVINLLGESYESALALKVIPVAGNPGVIYKTRQNMSISFIDARTKSSSDTLPNGEQIKEIRKKLGWSQEKLSDLMKKAGLPISQSEISLIERGRESQPVKAGYKETHDPTKPKFLGKSYHGYRERLRIFFLRHGVVFLDDSRILISNIDTIYEPFLSALNIMDFGGKPQNQDDISNRRRDFEQLSGAALAEAARWTLSSHFVRARDDYASGKNSIPFDEAIDVRIL